MKTVAYLRVSTGGQDLDSQRLAILDYAHRYHLHIDDFVEVTVSSRKTLKERGIEGLCAGMQAGDLMVVSELPRLGRSVGQIIQIVDDLVKNQIRFVAIKENIQLNGQQDIQGKVMVTMFGLFAEYAECGLMRSRAGKVDVPQAFCRRGTPHYPAPQRAAISASGALKRPRCRPGGNIACTVSSFSDGSTCR